MNASTRLGNTPMCVPRPPLAAVAPYPTPIIPVWNPMMAAAPLSQLVDPMVAARPPMARRPSMAAAAPLSQLVDPMAAAAPLSQLVEENICEEERKKRPKRE